MIIEIDQKIKLELAVEKHAKPLFHTISENRKHLSEFLGWVENMQSVEDTRQYLKTCELLYQEEKEVSFVIFYGEEIVGRIGIHYINHQNKVGAIGYWLSKKLEGKGIITKSCEALLNYGFGELKLNRIEIKAATENYKSQAIPQRLHFTREGVLRQAERINNSFVDLVLYSLLQSEWIESKNSSK